jgi:predicted dehydrogenase
VIGVDSSHLPEFSKRIKALHDAGQTPCRVTAFHDPGQHGMPAAEIAKWKQTTLDLGAVEVPTLDGLLGQVDGVLVLAVDGHHHAELALPALRRGLPTYVDKPLTCDLPGALGLLDAARKSKARCYSASSLRFAAEVTGLDKTRLGTLHAIDAFGPGELNAAMPGLFFYGVHTIEMVDALWGPGVKRARAQTTTDRDLLDLEYHDGRFARLRMERKGCYDFGATIHGDKGLASFKVDFADVYNRLVKGMTGFFEGKPAPADLRDIVENVAVMEAGNRSMQHGGQWVDVPRVE